MLSSAANVRNLLGECPLWCERTRRLYWTDIEGSELLAIEEDTDIVMRWALPERLGSFALTERENVLLMALASRLAFCNIDTGEFIPLAVHPESRRVPEQEMGDATEPVISSSGQWMTVFPRKSSVNLTGLTR